MTRALAIALPALVAVSLYAVLRDPAQPRTTSVPTLTAVAAPTVRAPLPAVADALPAMRDWAVGQQRIYDFDMALRIGLDDIEPQPSDAPLIHVRGDWTVTVLTIGDAVTLRAELADARLTPANYIESAEDLALPFQVTVARDGGLVEAAFPPEMGAAARQMLRQVAGAAQMTRPAGQTRWTANESDATGEYIAQYTLDGETLRRTKPRYLTLASAGAVKPVTGDVGFAIDSRSTFTLDASGHPATIVTEERMTVAGDTVMPTLSTLGNTRFTLRSVGKRDVTLTGEFDAEPIAAPLGSDAREAERLDRDLLGSDTLDSLLDDLSDAAQLERGDARKVRNLALPRLAAQFRLDPTSMQAALDALDDADEGTLRTVIAAVGATGTDASRDALIGLVDADQPRTLRDHALTAMNLMENANDATAQALTDLLDDDDEAVRHAAALALGGNARGGDFAETDPVSTLIARYAQAQSDGERMVIIDALGNAGDARAYPIIRGALSTPALSNSAVFALRFMPVAEVDEMLSTLLLQSPAEMMKLEALEVIAYRDRAAWQPMLASALKAEQSAKVQAAIRALL